MKSKPVVLSSAYLAPIQYYSKIISGEKILIEQFENFPKQTYRNRCMVLGANGSITLIVPVEKGRGGKTKTRDIKIYNNQPWQKNHWRTIFSAYNSSPYFEYYADELEQFYRKKYDFLLDYNLAINEWILDILEIETKIQLTTKFEGGNAEVENFCDIISPKNKTPDDAFTPQPYTQVFNEKFGFVPNLSIIDLIFNEGPNSLIIIEDSISRIV